MWGATVTGIRTAITLDTLVMASTGARIGQRWPTVGSATAMTMGKRVYRHCSNG